jgi:hypothetical protein
MEFVLELNTKNLGNSPSFLTITHATLSAKRFTSYGISAIDVAAEFCSGQNSGGTDLQFFCLGLAETPEVPNTVSDSNSLIFPMVHKTAPKG